MKPSYYNVALALLGLFALVLPFTGKVHDGRKVWYKGFTNRGWALIIAGFLGVISSYLKDELTDEIERGKDHIRLTKANNDKFENARTLSQSNANIIKSFTSALAIYGLKYDSSERNIKKILFSGSKKTQYTDSEKPELLLTSLTSIVNGNKRDFECELNARNSEAQNIDVVLAIADSINGKLRLMTSKVRIIGKGSNLSTGEGLKMGFHENFAGLAPDKDYFFMLYGTFTNRHKKQFSVRKYYVYDYKFNALSQANEPYFSLQKRFFDKMIPTNEISQKEVFKKNI